MSLKSSGLVKGIWHAIVLWLVGLVWGMIVFMVPLLIFIGAAAETWPFKDQIPAAFALTSSER